MKRYKEEAVVEVNAALDSLRANNQWEDKTKRGPLMKARDKLKSGAIPQLAPELGDFRSLQRFRDALVQIDSQRDSFQREFAASTARTSQIIRDVAASSRFREAVMWQNRTALHTALDALLRKTANDSRTSGQRQNEELVASYLQRYSVKNDTIGFFGPVGWAEFVSQGEDLVVNPGSSLIAARTLYFESWPIQELANVIARDRTIYRWLAPIRMPFISIEDSVVLHPIYGALRIPSGQIAVLRACDGVTSARQIAEELLRSRPSFFRNELEIYNSLAELASKNLVFWGFDVPLCPHPDRILREMLKRIGDSTSRERALALLEQLEAARDRVGTSAGDVEKLDGALDNLECTFSRLTGVSATRAHGQTYAGRTILYEDCRRDIEVRIGPELLREMVQPLTLLLAGARWLTWQIVNIYRKKLLDLYDEISSATGETVIKATDFWLKAMPFLVGEGHVDLGAPIQQEFQKKWARILRLKPSAGPIQLSSEELRDRVREEFATSRAGWPRARYHSPDIMVAAASAEAVNRGEYVIVLGEMHVASNTLAASLFVNQYPVPRELMRKVEQDMGTANLVPMPPKGEMQLISRTATSLISPEDLWLEYTLNGFVYDRSKAVPVSSLVVERCDDEIVVRALDGRVFTAVELAGWRFAEMVGDSFKMFIPSSHSPRISIDRMILKRELWRFTPDELSFALQAEGAERFLQCRDWGLAHGLPRFVFYKVPVETKPTYLDLSSPILVDIFCRMVRRTAEAGLPNPIIDVTEMLPAPDQVWLSDAAGNRYSCELRIVALDLAE
ncbi:MAG TPA: lantibiotic dehydratase [Candidatus Angelobacter sp.]